MKVIEMRTYTGRNIYSHKPVVKMVVDLEDFAEQPTRRIPGFNSHLLDLFPGLRNHHCSKGYEGGFCERLEEGTLLSHVIEHLALELQCLLGYDVYFGKSRIHEHPGIYCIIYEYKQTKEVAMACGRQAFAIISALAEQKDADIEQILARLQRMAAEFELGPSTKAIYEEAKKRHIPVQRLGNESLLQLGTGKYIRMIEASLPDTTSCIAVDLAKNKQLANQLLHENYIPVPIGEVVYTEEEAVNAANEIGYPVVIKPIDGNQGKGVTTNINNDTVLRSAYRLARSYGKQVLVESHLLGRDYRILVVGNKVAAVAERKPPHVVGDGLHSIAELVDQENRHPDRGVGHDKPLTKIRLDEVAREWLNRSEYSEDSIPTRGELITLRENGNLSTGGYAWDATQEIHPVNAALAIKAAQVIGLEVAGIDLVTGDITKPVPESGGAVIEVNAAPGLRMHLYPSRGTARNVAADILDYMYPPGSPSAVPIVAVTGSNGKTTITRLVNHVLLLSGKKTGMTCSSGTYIGGGCIAKGDHTGPLSARTVLSNREIDIAVLETARGGIIKRGLGYDLADVGVVVNVSEDHLGLNDIHTLQEMAFVKSLVAEAVKPEGYTVLNADDPMTPYISDGVKSNRIYFSQNLQNPILQDHINQGGLAVVTENDWIVCCENNCRVPLLETREIPITFSGKLACNIENALAAAASLRALGIADKVIAWGFKTFKPDQWNNAGRFNLFSLGDFQVLLDYGHNARGYQAVIQFLRQTDARRLVGIIGMPGDRSDQALLEVGRLSGQIFSRIYIKEDDDLRGRRRGETADLLYRGILEAGKSPEEAEIIYSELEALDAAIQDARTGDLIVIFYEHFDKVFDFLQKYIDPEDQHELLSLPAFAAVNKGACKPAEFLH